MGQQWAALITTSADALERGQQLGLGRAGPWSCDMQVPKKLEAQWSMHGMGFGITRAEMSTLFSGVGSGGGGGNNTAMVTEPVLDAIWSVFHCARNSGGGGGSGGGSGGSGGRNQTDVIDAVGLVVTYFLLSNATVNAKISAVFNFMDFNNRAWISGSELTILLMSLAYTLEDVAKNSARRSGTAGLPNSRSSNSNSNKTATAHDESDDFIEALLAESGNDRMQDGDHKVDYVAFFDGLHRVLAESHRRLPGVAVLARVLAALDPSNEVTGVTLAVLFSRRGVGARDPWRGVDVTWRGIILA
jgi:hypothetical protein